MLAADLVVGRAYAERPRASDTESGLRKIIFVGPSRAGKAKVRRVDGDLDGLEEWVPTRTLKCPWGERQAFLRDESRWNALREASFRDYDQVVAEAISVVFQATGDETGFIRVWTVDPKRAQRLWWRAGLEGSPDQHPLAYTDRHGQMHLPYETALQFARAFAAAEPEPCIHYIQECEDSLRAEGYEPGGRYSHQVLREMRPAHALVREWTQAGELSLLREENERLRQVLDQALEALRRAGDERSANRLNRALHGR